MSIRLGSYFLGRVRSTVGMGRWLVESFPVAADLFEQANSVLGYDLLDLCLNGPADKLNATEYSQPHCLSSRWRLPRRYVRLRLRSWPRLKSLRAESGEYFRNLLCWRCFVRGWPAFGAKAWPSNAAAADLVNSGMASVIGLDLEAVTKLCDHVRGGR